MLYKDIKSALRTKRSSYASLKSAIDIWQIYQDYTYTYKKVCRTIVVGYGENGIQKLKLPCVYSAVRDIGAYTVPTIRQNFDIGYIIKGVAKSSSSYFSIIKNIHKVHSELDFSIYGWGQSDFFEVIKPIHKGWSQYNSILKGFVIGAEENLINYIRPVEVGFLDLNNYLKTTRKGSKDLNNLLKGFVRAAKRNLNIILKGYAQSYADVVSYISHADRDQSDIFTTILPVHKANNWLFSSIYPIFAPDLLYQVIRGFAYTDIVSHIHAFHVSPDLIASIYSVQPKDISSSLTSYAYFDLKSSIAGARGPYDLLGFVKSVEAPVLNFRLRALKGHNIKRDLKATIEYFKFNDLKSIITNIEAKNLTAFINATGSIEELESTVRPKVVHIKRFIKVSLLSARNLLGSINGACFGTGYSDIKSAIETVYASTIGGYVLVFKNYNYSDLKSYINMSNVLAENKFVLKLFSAPSNKVVHRIVVKKLSKPITQDVFKLKIISQRFRNLTSAIKSDIFHKDLTFSLIGVVPAPYYMEGKYIYNQKDNINRLVINLEQGHSTWQRQVKIAFRSAVREYLYSSEANKIISAPSKWAISFEGYNLYEKTGPDKINVVKKYLINLDNYDNIDEAIRDFIDRVAVYRESFIRSKITATGSFRLLGSTLRAYKYLFKDSENIKALVKGYNTNVNIDIPSNILAERYKGLVDLQFSIETITIAKAIVIDSPWLTEDLHDFPIKIVVSDTAGKLGISNKDLFYVSKISKLYIHDSFGNNLPIEIAFLDEVNNEAILYTRVPTIKAGSINMLYVSYKTVDNPNSGFTGSPEAQSVWKDYVTVMHLINGGAESAHNRTVVDNGTITIKPPEFVSVGNSVSFNGSYAQLSIPNHPALGPLITVEALVKPEAEGTGAWGNFVVGAGVLMLYNSYYNAAAYDNHYALNCFRWIQGKPADYMKVPIGTKAHIAGVSVGGTFYDYKDGNLEGSDSGTYSYSGGTMTLTGVDYRTSYTYRGIIAELMISNVVRSSEWIRMSNLSVTDNLLTY